MGGDDVTGEPSKRRVQCWVWIDSSIVASLNSKIAMLEETNRRLNRRCQQAESELNTLRHDLSAATKVLQTESVRAHVYADRIRRICQHHEVLDRKPWIKCWFCRLRRWVRFQIWNRMFAIKETNRHIR